MLAGISSDYYLRLERGRDHNPSEPGALPYEVLGLPEMKAVPEFQVSTTAAARERDGFSRTSGLRVRAIDA
jgi:hypothetical protein